MATEKRLIDANALADTFAFLRKMWSGAEIVAVIDKAPTVDAVEVVHVVGDTAGAALVDAVQMIEESLKPEVSPEQKAREEGHLVLCGKKMDSRICDGNCDECDERNAELHAILCDFFSKQAKVEKHCGECDLTDGTILTSDPPQVRCPVTGKFHRLDDVCDCSNGRNRNA